MFKKGIFIALTMPLLFLGVVEGSWFQKKEALSPRICKIETKYDPNVLHNDTAKTKVIYTGFKQKKIWLDDEGHPINAHGAGFLLYKGTYYWFGEYNTIVPNRDRFGFYCYSSKDLYNWHNEGQCFDTSSISKKDIPEGVIFDRPERPKVVYNEKTGKFVMWFHLEDRKYETAKSAVAIADKVTGPYKYVRMMGPMAGYWPKNVRLSQKNPTTIQLAKRRGLIEDNGANPETPKYNILGRDFEEGQQARDMTVFKDDDGIAYHVYSSEHNSTLHIAKLTNDYLDHTSEYVRVFENRWMEAPAFMKRKGQYYFMGSDCTGYDPNAARSAVSPSMWGPWKELGNPTKGVSSLSGMGPELTFGGQITYFIKVNGKEDAYVAVFDVWTAENKEGEYGYYLFLPVTFTSRGFEIHWIEEWDLSWFDKKHLN